jgi:hypothetical protein
MNHTKFNRIVAFIIFIITFGNYLSTLPPTVVFWDVGEHCAASYLVQVQHPPGSPLLVLVMRVASMIPYAADIAVRMHLVNVLASTIVVTLLYLITIRFMLMWRPVPETLFDRISVYGSAAIGALALTFSTTFWFNSLEVETRNTSLLFTALIIWLALRWYERADEKHSDLYLLMIAFLVGLTTGVHIHGLLGFFVAILVVYFRHYKKSLREFLTSMDVIKFGVVASLMFFTAYPGIVKWLPSMLDSEVFGIRSSLWVVLAIGIVATAIYLVFYSIREHNRILNIGALSFLLILLGYSTYITVFIRANAETPIDENNPNTLSRFVTYLEREQYGETPLIERRFSNEPDKIANFKKYSSDLDYLWRYQINHMYLRYLGWNFIGKVGDWQDAGVTFSQLFAIPFIVGFFGLYFHWRNDQKMAFIMAIFFLLTGLVLAVYFNMQEPQPRERDYFFVYSFWAFCLWIGIGVLGFLDTLKERLQGRNLRLASYGVLVLAFAFIPGNMFRTNLHPMSRRGHYLAWDYSYNLLQSVEKDAILVTQGDNDTFPLWYLQDVEGVRRDVRIVNLSLANTDWYIMQLKHTTPFGAKTVPLSIPDEQIDGILPIRWQAQQMQLPVPQFAEQGKEPDSNDPHSTDIVDTVKWVMPVSLQIGNVSALRVQDIVVFDMIRTAAWRRPIYFAISVGPDGSIGLRDYLQLRGLAYKLVPQRFPNFWAAVDEDVTMKDVMTNVTKPSLGPAEGFRWRGLQDSTVHFDENQRRMISSYRQPFFSLALYFINEKKDTLEADKVLARMEEVIPRRQHPMDYRFKWDISTLYELVGDKAVYREYLSELTQELATVVQGGPTEQLSQYNPYIVLMQAYEGLGEYDKALETVDLIARDYASTKGVQGFIAGAKAEIAASRARRDTTKK